MAEPTAAVARPRRAFWVFWGLDALIAAVVVFFFLWGLSDGTVSSFNMLLWLAMLAGVGVVVGGSVALHKAGQTAAAFALVMVLAIPGLGIAALFLAILILQPRWN